VTGGLAEPSGLACRDRPPHAARAATEDAADPCRYAAWSAPPDTAISWPVSARAKATTLPGGWALVSSMDGVPSATPSLRRARRHGFVAGCRGD